LTLTVLSLPLLGGAGAAAAAAARARARPISGRTVATLPTADPALLLDAP
jgi:hypothetical protein